MGSTYKPFSLSENQVDTGPSWFNRKYLPFWSRKTYVTKIQPFQVIPFRLVWLGLISWQSTQHHWNTLWILWPNKNITATIWTCPDPGWQNMFMKKESSWCWLVPNFQLPEFHGKQKNTTSEDGNIEIWWVPSSLEELKKGHVVRNSICKTFPPKITLIALFNIMIPPAEQKTTESKQKSKLLSSRDVFPGATGSGGSGRWITGPTSGVGACVAAMAARWCTKALWTPILFCFRGNQKKKFGAFLLVILLSYQPFWIHLTNDNMNLFNLWWGMVDRDHSSTVNLWKDITR